MPINNHQKFKSNQAAKHSFTEAVPNDTVQRPPPPPTPPCKIYSHLPSLLISRHTITPRRHAHPLLLLSHRHLTLTTHHPLADLLRLRMLLLLLLLRLRPPHIQIPEPSMVRRLLSPDPHLRPQLQTATEQVQRGGLHGREDHA